MIKLAVTVQAGRLELDKKMLRATMRSAGGELASVARSLVRKSAGTGRLYRGHRASAPGQPPASLSGLLASSIKVKVYKSGEGVAVIATARSRGGSGAPYARFLEVGAQGGVGSGKKGLKGSRNIYKKINRKNVRVAVVGTRVMLPRPFLTIALQQREASIAQRVAASINQGVKFQRVKP